MTLTVSFQQVVEEALSERAQQKNLAGNVRDFHELMKPENLKVLEASHNGAFAFLAFHPTIDQSVERYVRAKSLASDSGPRVMVLYVTTPSSRGRTKTAPELRGLVQVDAAVQPAYEMVRLLFDPQASPPLPGVAFFKDFSPESEATYVELSGLADEQAVAERLRSVFSIVDSILATHPQSTGSGLADEVSTRLQMMQIPHSRTGRKSVGEWFVQCYQFVRDHKDDIVALVNLAKPSPSG